jgi:esterase/lipase superfamily enzyme
MGNRALIKVLENTGSEPSAILENVILAAADENLPKFEAMLAAMHNRSSGPLISVYSSAFDWPLFASEFFQWKLRLGNTYSFFGGSIRERNWPKVDVVDASGVEYDNVQQHSYHAAAEEVLDDIAKLLKNSDTRAECRTDLSCHKLNCANCGWVFYAFVSTHWDRYNIRRYSSGLSVTAKVLACRTGGDLTIS